MNNTAISTNYYYLNNTNITTTIISTSNTTTNDFSTVTTVACTFQIPEIRDLFLAAVLLWMTSLCEQNKYNIPVLQYFDRLHNTSLALKTKHCVASPHSHSCLCEPLYSSS